MGEAAITGEKTLIQLVQDFDVHTNQIKQWRDQLREGGHSRLPRLTESVSPQSDLIRTEKLRCAPLGGWGNGAARRTTRSAARSSRADPELRANPTPARLPSLAMLNRTIAAPRLLSLGRGTRESRAMTSPG